MSNIFIAALRILGFAVLFRCFNEIVQAFLISGFVIHPQASTDVRIWPLVVLIACEAGAAFILIFKAPQFARVLGYREGADDNVNAQIEPKTILIIGISLVAIGYLLTTLNGVIHQLSYAVERSESMSSARFQKDMMISGIKLVIGFAVLGSSRKLASILPYSSEDK
jgi:hypothetical protein